MPDILEFATTVEFRLLMLTFLVLVGPIVAERLRLPGLVGLIFFGMLFGPFVLGWVGPEGMIAVVGAIGLLYLMFLAGLELDINTFVANRRASITFGILTFLFPFGISFYVGTAFLDLHGVAAALVGAMWASHTLVAYTEVKEAGLESNRAIGAAVSATILTDVLALLILGFSATADTSAGEPSQSSAEHLAVMPVWIGVFVVAGFCMWLLPRITKWFFTNVGRSRIQRFVWTLGGMAAGSFVALLGGMEGLVGAFLAGIGMNRMVPARGQLMERIEFFGAALFVPAFLITVGTSIDPAAIAQWETVRLALIFTALVVVGKTLAAVAAGVAFRFSFAEIGMMASLTVGQAAATLAIAQVGVSNGTFDQEILNAAVLTVVFTVIITSLATRFFAKRMDPPSVETGAIGRRVLLRVEDFEDIEGMVELALAIGHPDDGLVTPFVVCGEQGCPELSDRLGVAVQHAVDRGHDTDGVTRVSESSVSGTLNFASEVAASSVVLPWEGPSFPANLFFGSDIDQVGTRSVRPVIAARMLDHEWKRVLFIGGRTRGLSARQEDGDLALEVARRIGREHELEVVPYISESSNFDTEEFPIVRTYRGRSTRPLTAITPGDVVVIPAFVAEDAMGFGLIRLTRYFDHASLVVVGGPHRLHVSTRAHGDRILNGVAFNRASREDLAATWEGGTG